MKQSSDMSLARFEAEYDGAPAWEIGKPQQYFLECFNNKPPITPALDVGCGSGDLALYLASLGCETLGIDFVPRAIELASAKAEKENLPVTFLCHDAFDLPALGREFLTVTDSCFFHTFSEESVRRRYTQALAQIMPPGADLYLLGFAIDLPTPNAPTAVTESVLQDSFGSGWHLEALAASTVAVSFMPEGIPATAAWLKRI